MMISGVDWNHRTNCIVTASHDRNAFVWNEEVVDGTKTWKPSLVILRIDKSALDVKWSPNGLKFAAASGAKCVSVCSFADEDNWWVSKTIKKHKSTVLSLAWHPNSEFLATGSSDFKCRVFSAYISTEGKPDPVTPTPCQGKVAEFGEVYYEFPTTGTVGWVNACAWSPSGETLAYACHDSSIGFATFPPGGGDPLEQVIRLNDLPLVCLQFVSDTGLVGAGHGYSPLALSRSASGEWAVVGALEAAPEAKAVEKVETSGAASARAMFAKMDLSSKPAAGAQNAVDISWKAHQSSVTTMTPSGGLAQGSKTFGSVSTTSMDGRLVIWDLTKTTVKASALGV